MELCQNSNLVSGTERNTEAEEEHVQLHPLLNQLVRTESEIEQLLVTSRLSYVRKWEEDWLKNSVIVDLLTYHEPLKGPVWRNYRQVPKSMRPKNYHEVVDNDHAAVRLMLEMVKIAGKQCLKFVAEKLVNAGFDLGVSPVVKVTQKYHTLWNVYHRYVKGLRRNPKTGKRLRMECPPFLEVFEDLQKNYPDVVVSEDERNPLSTMDNPADLPESFPRTIPSPITDLGLIHKDGSEALPGEPGSTNPVVGRDNTTVLLENPGLNIQDDPLSIDCPPQPHSSLDLGPIIDIIKPEPDLPEDITVLSFDYCSVVLTTSRYVVYAIEVTNKQPDLSYKIIGDTVSIFRKKCQFVSKTGVVVERPVNLTVNEAGLCVLTVFENIVEELVTPDLEKLAELVRSVSFYGLRHSLCPGVSEDLDLNLSFSCEKYVKPYSHFRSSKCVFWTNSVNRRSKLTKEVFSSCYFCGKSRMLKHSYMKLAEEQKKNKSRAVEKVQPVQLKGSKRKEKGGGNGAVDGGVIEIGSETEDSGLRVSEQGVVSSKGKSIADNVQVVEPKGPKRKKKCEVSGAVDGGVGGIGREKVDSGLRESEPDIVNSKGKKRTKRTLVTSDVKERADAQMVEVEDVDENLKVPLKSVIVLVPAPSREGEVSTVQSKIVYDPLETSEHSRLKELLGEQAPLRKVEIWSSGQKSSQVRKNDDLAFSVMLEFLKTDGKSYDKIAQKMVETGFDLGSEPVKKVTGKCAISWKAFRDYRSGVTDRAPTYFQVFERLEREMPLLKHHEEECESP